MKIICKLVEILKINNCILVCINLWCHDCLVCRHIHDTCRTQQISDYKYDKIFYRVISDYKYDFFIFEQAMLTTRSSVILVVSRRTVTRFDPTIASVACEKDGKFGEAPSISGAMLNEFKRKDWGEEKIGRDGVGGGGGGRGDIDHLPEKVLRFWISASLCKQNYLTNRKATLLG